MNINNGYFRRLFSIHMKIFENINTSRDYVQSIKNQKLSLGFVPTMGALHEGHLSLVRKAKSENNCLAISIFVNPIQFNNPSDLRNYPRTVQADLELLKNILTDRDFVFIPSVSDMYPQPVKTQYDFGSLAQVMEGSARPGHFNGVGVVINRLYRIIEPDTMYFGEKDFQQLAIIRRLTAIEQLPVKIVPCPIIREADGLAMSSRNVRLTPDHRQAAPAIFATLSAAMEKIPVSTPNQLRQFITTNINQTGLLCVEYV